MRSHQSPQQASSTSTTPNADTPAPAASSQPSSKPQTPARTTSNKNTPMKSKGPAKPTPSASPAVTASSSSDSPTISVEFDPNIPQDSKSTNKDEKKTSSTPVDPAQIVITHSSVVASPKPSFAEGKTHLTQRGPSSHHKRGKAKHTSVSTSHESSESSTSSSALGVIVPEPVKVLPKKTASEHATPTKPASRSESAKSETSNSAANRGATASRIARNILGTPNPSGYSPAPKTPLHRGPKERTPLRTPLPRGTTPAHYRDRMNRGRVVYPEHMSIEKAREEVKAGRAWEGTLRANPNAPRMCFFTVPGRTKDLMVKDEWLNRAFPGDTVIIQMLDEKDLIEEDKFQERRAALKNGRNGNNGSKSASGKSGSAEKSTDAKNATGTSSPRGTPSRPSSSASTTSSSRKSTPLRSEVLKGLEPSSDEDYSSDDHDLEESDDSDYENVEKGSGVAKNRNGKTTEQKMDVDAIGDLQASSSTPSSSESPASGAVKTEAELAAEAAHLAAEMEMLNLSTHARFSAANFSGIMEEDKPKSELAKVICITNAYHEQMGFVGRVMRRRDGGFELKPLAAQHPMFDVPAPTEYLDRIPDYEVTEAEKKKKRSGRKVKKEMEDAELLFITYFDRWGVSSRRPLGVVPKFIGESGDIEAECRAITSTHSIDTTPHATRLSAQFGDSKTIVIDEETLRVRKDLRTTRIFTVDPPTARDIDDALSIEKISSDSGPGGKTLFRVGVHIADVSHYVTPGSDLDAIAKQRSTSVYMVNTMYPMLPGVLSENLCSLNPKVDRLAFSVMWDLDENGNIVGNEWIGRTIVRSCAKLSYLDAQKCIDAQLAGDLSPGIEHLASLNPEQPAEGIAGDILNLNMLAQRMRERRFSGGALRLSRLRLHFELGPDGYPIDAHPYYIKESNQLIEEFMLLANMSVAKFIYASFPQNALLRSHPEPKDDMLESFGYLMKALDIPFDTSTSGALYQSLLKLEDWQHRPVEELVTKAMNAAIYLSTGTITEEKELWHYALNVPFYTHFTSPIRRYPDIVVHRQIQLAIDKREGTLYRTIEDVIHADPASDANWVAEVADHANERKRASRKAQDDSIKLFACLWLKRQVYNDPESIVLDISRNKITVFSPELCTRIRIDISEKKGYRIKFNTETRVLSIYDTSANKLLISATYFSKVPITYFTKGKLPMDIGAEFTFWYTPPPTPAESASSKIASGNSNNNNSNNSNPTALEQHRKTPAKATPSPPADANTVGAPAAKKNTQSTPRRRGGKDSKPSTPARNSGDDSVNSRNPAPEASASTSDTSSSQPSASEKAQ